MISFHRAAASFVLIGFGITGAHAACLAPKAPTSMPNGAVATLDEMKDGQKAVKQFQADMAVYRKCIDEENPPAPAGAPLTDDQKKAQDAREKERMQKHNDSVTQETAVADEFNQQIHAYKEAQAAKKNQ